MQMVFGRQKKEVERGGAGAVVAAARRAIGHEHKEKTAAEKVKEELGEFCCPALTLKQQLGQAHEAIVFRRDDEGG